MERKCIFEFAKEINRDLGTDGEVLNRSAVYDILLEGRRELDALRGEMTAFVTECDVILCPTAPIPAFKHGGSAQPQFASGQYTQFYNVAGGYPAAVVRCGTSPEGLPIGVQIVSNKWREDIALAVAEFLEREFGGWKLPPAFA